MTEKSRKAHRFVNTAENPKFQKALGVVGFVATKIPRIPMSVYGVENQRERLMFSLQTFCFPIHHKTKNSLCKMFKSTFLTAKKVKNLIW